MPYELTLPPGREAMAPYLRLTIPVRPPFRLSLRKESLDTRLSKHIGMARELITGVDDFDDDYFIQTNDENACRRFLSVAAHREAIRDIHAEGFTITFGRKDIRMSRPVTGDALLDTSDVSDAAQIKRLLDDVHVLLRGLSPLGSVDNER